MALTVPRAESTDVVNCHCSTLLERRKHLGLKYMTGFTYGNSKTLLCINVSNTHSIRLLKDKGTQKNVYSGMATQYMRHINPPALSSTLSPIFLWDSTRVTPEGKMYKIYSGVIICSRKEAAALTCKACLGT